MFNSRAPNRQIKASGQNKSKSLWLKNYAKFNFTNFIFHGWNVFVGLRRPRCCKRCKNRKKKNEAAGSPYRLRAYRVPGGTAVEKYRVIPPSPIAVPTDLQPTTANAELRTDVLNKIAALQQDWGNSNAPDLLGVKPEGVVQNSIKESWFIKWDDNAIRYEVTMTPSPQGGTDFKLVGP
jgi:hypothetical protein